MLIKFLSYFYTLKVHKKLTSVKDALYTKWIRNYIGSVGEKTIISRPLLLQGGGERRIKIGAFTVLGHHTVLGCWEHYGNETYEPEIVIGNHCNIGEYSHISAINKISIGDGLLTGRFVYIGDNSHGSLSWEEANMPPAKRPLKSKGEIIIGQNVWIGDKTSILGGVTIGDNVIIGAGAMVTHNIPSNCIVAGIPARIVKQL